MFWSNFSTLSSAFCLSSLPGRSNAAGGSAFVLTVHSPFKLQVVRVGGILFFFFVVCFFFFFCPSFPRSPAFEYGLLRVFCEA